MDDQVFIRFVKKYPQLDIWVEILAKQILDRHFREEWTVLEDRSADVTLRVQRLPVSQHPCGNQHFVDHVVVKAARASEYLHFSLERLKNALGQIETESGRCWAMLFRGLNITLYEYHQYLPVNDRLICKFDSLHIERNSIGIQALLAYIARGIIPPQRPRLVSAAQVHDLERRFSNCSLEEQS
ncbi:hypothetical protein BBP40_005310 [Aspergillus hancockii]|nr:hypothetical protein BBP40_005310 [Aspergillus hancockii]